MNNVLVATIAIRIHLVESLCGFYTLTRYAIL